MIISVPTIFSCKISTGWLNLAQVRQLEIDDINPNLIRVTWVNGHSQLFVDEDAKAIIEAWEDKPQSSKIDGTWQPELQADPAWEYQVLWNALVMLRVKTFESMSLIRTQEKSNLDCDAEVLENLLDPIIVLHELLDAMNLEVMNVIEE